MNESEEFVRYVGEEIGPVKSPGRRRQMRNCLRSGASQANWLITDRLEANVSARLS